MAALTYSFKDLVFVINHPVAGTFVGNGQVGAGKLTFTKTTTRATQEVSADGTVLTSIVVGDGGKIMFEVQQTSPLHAFFLGMSNDIDAAAAQGNLTYAVAATISAQAITAQATHYASGVTIEKQADKSYDAQSAMVTWTLLAAELVNE